MRSMRMWMGVLAALLMAVGGVSVSRADVFAIRSFDGTGRLAYNTLNNGTSYNYRVEWAPAPGGPWSEFGSAGSFWLNGRPQAAGTVVTNTVPICYRVVAMLGDYLSIDVSEGPEATSYPVIYYRTLADVPNGPNSDAYKTTKILMRLIPKGVFTMGSPLGELDRANNEMQHQVTLTQDFYVGVFEVTQRQWERVMGTWPSYFNNAAFRDSRPVERVSYEAIRGSGAGAGWPANGNVDDDSFMGRLRARTGCFFDLPTEAQWEYAGRAGTVTALNSGKHLTGINSCPNMAELGRYKYNGVLDPGSYCDLSGGTAMAGSYLPNAWFLYDIHGNVWEWCLDRFGTYPGSIADPRGGPATVTSHVVRGGGWFGDARRCRVGYRSVASPSTVNGDVGFRAVMPLGQQ